MSCKWSDAKEGHIHVIFFIQRFVLELNIIPSDVCRARNKIDVESSFDVVLSKCRRSVCVMASSIRILIDGNTGENVLNNEWHVK